MSLEVSVISNRSILDDPVSWFAGATRIGEIEVSNVIDMATKIKALRDAQAVTTESAVIGRLNIMDHSVTDGKTITGFKCGTDVVTMSNLAEFEPSFRKIGYCMSKRGFVHLMACQIGKNETLLKGVARIVGCDVYAGTGDHNPIYRFNFGDYVVCTPDGHIKRNVPRPSMVD